MNQELFDDQTSPPEASCAPDKRGAISCPEKTEKSPLNFLKSLKFEVKRGFTAVLVGSSTSVSNSGATVQLTGVLLPSPELKIKTAEMKNAFQIRYFGINYGSQPLSPSGDFNHFGIQRATVGMENWAVKPVVELRTAGFKGSAIISKPMTGVYTEKFKELQKGDYGWTYLVSDLAGKESGGDSKHREFNLVNLFGRKIPGTPLTAEYLFDLSFSSNPRARFVHAESSLISNKPTMISEIPVLNKIPLIKNMTIPQGMALTVMRDGWAWDKGTWTVRLAKLFTF